MPTFAALAPAYARLWAELVPTPAHEIEMEGIVRRLLAHKSIYQEVEHATGVPWWWVGITDEMEGGGGASTYLGNGQSLHHVTTEVPAGRGPFPSFLAGAIDAIRYDGIDDPKPPAGWTVTWAAYKWEGWNGWGYLNKSINDPYLASFSNKYTKGKWVADHVYDPEAVSQQPGALTILKVLVTLDPSIDLSGGKPAPAPVPTGPTAPTQETPVTTPGLSLDFTQIEKQLEGVLASINGFGWLLPPQVKGILAFAPIVEGALTIVGDLQHADWSHSSIASILSRELRKMADAIDAAPKAS
jgi:lysozyme family protein